MYGVAKTNAAAIRRSESLTGNPSPCNIILTDLQRRIIDMLGETLVTGDPNTGEAGVSRS